MKLLMEMQATDLWSHSLPPEKLPLCLLREITSFFLEFWIFRKTGFLCTGPWFHSPARPMGGSLNDKDSNDDEDTYTTPQEAKTYVTWPVDENKPVLKKKTGAPWSLPHCPLCVYRWIQGHTHSHCRDNCCWNASISWASLHNSQQTHNFPACWSLLIKHVFKLKHAWEFLLRKAIFRRETLQYQRRGIGVTKLRSIQTPLGEGTPCRHRGASVMGRWGSLAEMVSHKHLQTPVLVFTLVILAER